jgi:uncharacterized protein (DUF1778 family)
MKKVKKKPGRPALGNGHSARLPSVRITKDELEAYKRAAQHEGKTIADWVRSALKRALARL